MVILDSGGAFMGSDDEAKRRQAEAEKAKLLHDVQIAREQQARDQKREMERDLAKLDDKFK